MEASRKREIVGMVERTEKNLLNYRANSSAGDNLENGLHFPPPQFCSVKIL